MHPPTIRQLQFLVALADEGSFSKAAGACHVTQPTLSAAIREVEGLLGVQLVERQARGAQLTPSGSVVVERARRILADVDDLIMAASDSGRPLTGPFRLGAIPTIAPYVLPFIASDLTVNHSELKLILREDITARLMEGLRARTLDAAIVALPWDMRGIETEILFEDPFSVVCPADHEFAQQSHVTMDDLKETDLLLLDEGHCLREHALAACEFAPRQNRDLSATSLHTLLYMVGGGIGISLVPQLAIDAGVIDQTKVAVRPFNKTVAGRTVAIAWRAGSPHGESAKLIGESIRRAQAARASECPLSQVTT